MLQTLTAIQSAFNANPVLAGAFAAGLEVALAADSEALPLCVLAIIPGGGPGYSTASEHNGTTPLRSYTDEMWVQFTVYSSDGTFCAQMLDQLIQTFDHKPLTLATEKWLDTRQIPGVYGVARADERSARGDVQFAVTIQRQLGS